MAEAQLSRAYDEYADNIKNRDNEQTGIEALDRKISDAQRDLTANYNEREWSRVAKSGDAGTAEALRAIKREIDTPARSTNLAREKSRLVQTISDGEDSLSYRKTLLKYENQKIEVFIFNLQSSLDKYKELEKTQPEAPYDISKKGQKRRDMIRNIEQSLRNEQRRLASEISETRTLSGAQEKTDPRKKPSTPK